MLEAVLFWGHHISTFKLSYFDLPLSGCGGSSFVNIDVDLIALKNIFVESIMYYTDLFIYL